MDNTTQLADLCVLTSQTTELNGIGIDQGLVPSFGLLGYYSAILVYNHWRSHPLADLCVLTSSIKVSQELEDLKFIS